MGLAEELADYVKHSNYFVGSQLWDSLLIRVQQLERDIELLQLPCAMGLLDEENPQDEADRKLGALVRRMPLDWTLAKDYTQWEVIRESDWIKADTPEAALTAALCQNDTPKAVE